MLKLQLISKESFARRESVNKEFKEEVRLISDTKLFYERTIECNKQNKQLKLEITETKKANATFLLEQDSNQHLPHKILYKKKK